MNKKLVSKFLIFFNILVLAGCGSTTSTTSVVDAIENAASKNAEIESARFEKQLSMKSDSEQVNENTDGHS